MEWRRSDDVPLGWYIKGMKMVLEESGVNTYNYGASNATKSVRNGRFQEAVVELVESKGHLFGFLPKFHC